MVDARHGLQAAKIPNGGDYEALREYLRSSAVRAYDGKVRRTEDAEPGLMQVPFLNQMLEKSLPLSNFKELCDRKVRRTEDAEHGLMQVPFSIEHPLPLSNP